MYNRCVEDYSNVAAGDILHVDKRSWQSAAYFRGGDTSFIVTDVMWQGPTRLTIQGFNSQNTRLVFSHWVFNKPKKNLANLEDYTWE